MFSRSVLSFFYQVKETLSPDPYTTRGDKGKHLHQDTFRVDIPTCLTVQQEQFDPRLLEGDSVTHKADG